MRQPGMQSQVKLNAQLNLLGESPPFLQLLAHIERFARCDATVLVDGETGTGKELTARAIHYRSARRDGPFVPVNCGSLPDSLFGSELFGHARGAFTDAREARQGLIAQAEAGTLFLDELETLSAHGQVTLLRFLQDHEYRPLGAERARTANVRVIGATNADLARLADHGQFRQDLLYRLNVLTLDVPPLRTRGDDARVLAQAFLRKLCTRYQTPERHFHPDAIAALRAHHWPGNIRELENLIHREFLVADSSELMLATLPRGPGPGTERRVGARRQGDSARSAGGTAAPAVAFREAKARVIAEFEREYVRDLLRQCAGNVSQAARLAGKERSRFNRLVRKYRFDAREFRQPAP
ncbi:MAG TPA: sigma-54 dependent transcriptional regulator [Steroidobacteraceae bacterium]|nr:sigma-54 dependent transcriptional regulator [Steroidobacteraceae bacterium]